MNKSEVSRLDLVVQNEIVNQVHVSARLMDTVLLNNPGRHSNGDAVARQGGDDHRPGPHFTARPNLNGAQNTHSSPQQHPMACKRKLHIFTTPLALSLGCRQTLITRICDLQFLCLQLIQWVLEIYE